MIKHVKNTDSGGNSDYLLHFKPGNALPQNTWVQSVIYANCRRADTLERC